MADEKVQEENTISFSEIFKKLSWLDTPDKHQKLRLNNIQTQFSPHQLELMLLHLMNMYVNGGSGEGGGESGGGGSLDGITVDDTGVLFAPVGYRLLYIREGYGNSKFTADALYEKCKDCAVSPFYVMGNSLPYSEDGDTSYLPKPTDPNYGMPHMVGFAFDHPQYNQVPFILMGIGFFPKEPNKPLHVFIGKCNQKSGSVATWKDILGPIEL